MIFTHEFLNNTSAAPILAELHMTCFEKPWDTASFAKFLSLNGTVAQIILTDSIPIGFALYQTTDTEAEILTLGILPPLRKKNAGSVLLSKAKQHLAYNGIERIFLDVSQTNVAAQKLYENAGFKKVGKRKNYYTEGEEKSDALLLEITL